MSLSPCERIPRNLEANARGGVQFDALDKATKGLKLGSIWQGGPMSNRRRHGHRDI